ncbi:MAG: hypothetical protein ACT452_21085 [Microthrixaceae bacterium]
MRVAAVALAVCLAAAGCTQGQSEPARVAAPSSTTTTQLRLPASPRYTPIDGEPVPELKSLAANFVQALGTYELGGGNPEAAAVRVAGVATSATLPVNDLLLAPSASSTIEIIYPQLGGLIDDAASIMVVFRWRLLEGGREVSVTRTADVRLALEAGTWRVASVESLGGDTVDPGSPSPIAQAVLANERIELPDSARWDINSGRISDEVLQVLDGLATDHTLRVSVLASGHPHNVFATDLVSNHTEGRGVDIWAIDGQPVVSLRDPAGPLPGLVQELISAGVTEVGSPFDIDGAGGASFTNTVHQDHLHVAFDG